MANPRTPLSDSQRLELYLAKGMPFKVGSVEEFNNCSGILNVSNPILLAWVDEIQASFPDRRYNMESKWLGIISSIASASRSYPLLQFNFHNKLFINQTGKALFGDDPEGKLRQFTLDCLEILYHLVYEEMQNAD